MSDIASAASNGRMPRNSSTGFRVVENDPVGPSESRDSLLDAMRSVSILRVVLIHTAGRFGEGAIALFTFILPGMPVVFFVSGSLAYFALAGARSNAMPALDALRRFWLTRARRLFVPFWTYAALVVPILLVADARSGHRWHAFDERAAWRWVFPLLEPMASPALRGFALHLWFVPPFLWLLVAAPLLVAIHRRRPWLLMFLTLVAAASVEFVGENAPSALRNTLVYGVAFQAGFGFADGSLLHLSRRTLLLLALSLLAIGGAIHRQVAPDAILNAVPLAHVLVGLAAVPLWLAFRSQVTRVFEIPVVAAASLALNRRAYTIFIWGPVANELAWRAARAAPEAAFLPVYFAGTAILIFLLARWLGRLELRTRSR